jgi:hypothetical protein
MNITSDDILEQIDLAEKTRNKTIYPNDSYEDGVISALLWILYDGEQVPPIIKEATP